MNLPPLKAANDGYNSILAVVRQLLGQSDRTLFGDTNDDGTKMFPGLVPEGEPRTPQNIQSRELLGQRVKRCQQTAFQRDAQYAYASRGRLLLQAHQTDVVIAFDAGRQLELSILT